MHPAVQLEDGTVRTLNGKHDLIVEKCIVLEKLEADLKGNRNKLSRKCRKAILGGAHQTPGDLLQLLGENYALVDGDIDVARLVLVEDGSQLFTKERGAGKLTRLAESLGLAPHKVTNGELHVTVGLCVIPEGSAAPPEEDSEDAPGSQDHRVYPLLQVKLLNAKKPSKARSKESQLSFKESDRNPANRIEAGVLESFKHGDFPVGVPAAYVSALGKTVSAAMYDIGKDEFDWESDDVQAYLAQPSTVDFPTGLLPDICDISSIRDACPGVDALEYFAALLTMGVDGARKASTRDELVDSLLLMATSNGFKPKGGSKEKLRTAMLSGAAPGNNAGNPTTASALLKSAEKAATATATAATTKANAMLRVAELANDGRNAAAVYEKSGKRVLEQENFELEVSPGLCDNEDEAQIEFPFGVDINVSKDSLETIQDYSVDDPLHKKVANTKPAAHVFLPFLRQYHGFEGDGDGISVSLDYDGKVTKVRSVKNITIAIMVHRCEDTKDPPKFKLSLV